ncbi:restriction endonuclease [Streptomyces hyaluromycini]|uniref:Restriction endonuclease n=1 Tax=Streptomyces hyaluromycini TaxID=1377993 RepID=A0ABV1WSH0_9ACTN
MTGGLCIIQAKRTKNTGPAESVRALAGVMHDRATAKGILIATAWFGKTSLDFVQRTGHMQLIDGRGLKALLQEQIGMDALIGIRRSRGAGCLKTSGEKRAGEQGAPDRLSGDLGLCQH